MTTLTERCPHDVLLFRSCDQDPCARRFADDSEGMRSIISGLSGPEQTEMIGEFLRHMFASFEVDFHMQTAAMVYALVLCVVENGGSIEQLTASIRFAHDDLVRRCLELDRGGPTRRRASSMPRRGRR